MKLKGIWITICLIIVAGVCATSYTRQYTTDAAATRALVESTSPAVAVPQGREAAAPAAASFSETEAVAEAAEAALDVAQNEALQSTAVSPLILDLEDLDDQIARSHTGTADTTTNSLKALAESEWKLWEVKMNRYLDILEDVLSTEEKEALFVEQKGWIREREELASAASRKQTGSALVELEYNLSLKEITRARVYDLAGRYEAELTQGQTQ